jgi:hypothetical protein
MKDGRGAPPGRALNESQPAELAILRNLAAPDTNLIGERFVTQVAAKQEPR